MKNVIRILSVIAVLSVSSALFAFNSTPGSYQYGKQDVEYTMATVASNITITKGQWVMLAASDGQGYDTGAVVTTDNSGAENSALVYGVADQTGDSGQMIRIITHGYTTAYINGTDTSTAAGIAQGEPLSLSFIDGTAGSVTRTGSASGAATTAPQAAGTKVCGVLLGTVATSDSGTYPALATKYGVYVTVR